MVSSVGSHAPKSMISVGFITLFSGAPVRRQPMYSRGAVGGVMLPMPRFTPMIAAKWMGYNPPWTCDAQFIEPYNL